MSSAKSTSANEERPAQERPNLERPHPAGGAQASSLQSHQKAPARMPGEPQAGMPALQVTRTYLEMRDRSELRGAKLDDPLIRIVEQCDCPIELFRFLYVEVGKNYHWVDRLPWTDEQITDYLTQPEISLWLMTYADETAGYFELRKCEDGSTEIAYFGLIGNFIGRGLGKHLLTCAVEQAWADGTNCVWLHTCTLDDAAAMPNYLKRGFRPFKTENYEVAIESQAAQQHGSPP